MFEYLRNPEYVHVLLNPLPVYGLAIGVLALVIALATRVKAARVTALALVFVSALSAWPVHQYGEAAYDRVLAMADNDGSQWLKEHQRRSESLIYAFYALALVAAATMLCEQFAPRAALPLGIASLLIAIASLGIGAYIAQAGGRIRHREFRYEPPPQNATEPNE